MSAGNTNDTTDLRRPRYLAEKTHCMRYVGLHLSALKRVQRALRNREQADFVLGNQRLGNAVQIGISPRCGLSQPGKHGFRSCRGHIALQYVVPERIEFGAVFLKSDVGLLRPLVVGPLTLGSQKLQLRSQQLGLRSSLGKQEPMAQELQLRRIELLLLQQYVFPDADFAEIV